MVNLINDMLLRTGLLRKISQEGAERIVWFQGVTFMDIVASVLMPFMLFLSIAIYLKIRYNRKKARDSITLSNFFPHR